MVALRQHADAKSERLEDASQSLDRWISRAVFDFADLPRRQSAQLRQLGLRQPVGGAYLADPFGQRNVTGGHPVVKLGPALHLHGRRDRPAFGH